MKCRQFVDLAQPDILCRHSDAACRQFVLHFGQFTNIHNRV